MASRSRWKIKIKTLKADSFDLNINSDSTVDELKQQIEKIKSITPNLQRLIFRGRILKPSTKLKDYEITNGSTIHLVVRKASNTNNNHSQNAQQQSSNNNNNNAQNNSSNPHPNAVPFSNIQHHQQAQINAIQAMFGNMPPHAQAVPVPPGVSGVVPGAVAPPQMMIRRMPMNATSSNTIRNVYDNDEEEKDKQEAIDVKRAEFDTESDTNLMKWKLKRSKLQNWIKNGAKYASYFSEEQQLNNGSVWRFFIYPNGINQAGYHEDTVLFIMLESLPFGVDALDIEFALHFKACNVHFKFRKTFTHFVRSAGWPRNFLLMSKVLDISQKQYVKLTCDLLVHSVIVNGSRMTNHEYMNWKTNNAIYDERVSKKPNSRLFRWKLDKKAFVDAQFKQYQQSKRFDVNGFKFYLQIYPNGLGRNGFVQPYLHLIKMPPNINKIDAHFTFYFREINVGYSHIDIFNGKMGKGWPEMKLKREHFKWNELKSITVDCRVTILNVSCAATAWFINDLGLKKDEKVDNNQKIKDEEEKEEEKNVNGHNLVEKEKEKQNERERKKQKKMNKDELRKWLIADNLGKYYEKFIENEIQSLDDVLQFIDEKNNLKEIGVKPFAHRVKIWKNILKLHEMRQYQNDDEACTF